MSAKREALCDFFFIKLMKNMFKAPLKIIAVLFCDFYGIRLLYLLLSQGRIMPKALWPCLDRMQCFYQIQKKVVGLADRAGNCRCFVDCKEVLTTY